MKENIYKLFFYCLFLEKERDNVYNNKSYYILILYINTLPNIANKTTERFIVTTKYKNFTISNCPVFSNFNNSTFSQFFNEILRMYL